jgi:acyloxyacyl hydrolase
VDHDCNGIYGADDDGVSFEEKFCSGTERRGVVILGDSATAHFHVPPAWLTADGWDVSVVLSNA